VKLKSQAKLGLQKSPKPSSNKIDGISTGFRPNSPYIAHCPDIQSLSRRVKFAVLRCFEINGVQNTLAALTHNAASVCPVTRSMTPHLLQTGRVSRAVHEKLDSSSWKNRRTEEDNYLSSDVTKTLVPRVQDQN